MNTCRHPNRDQAQVRRFRYAGGSYFALQCPDCRQRVGPKIPADELGVHPKEVPWAQRTPKKRGRTGLGGNGNSKRRDFEARFRHASWRGLRDRVLDRDDHTCQSCGEAATEVHHVTYERFWYERLEDLVASCRNCNLAEREQRIGGGHGAAG